MLIFVVAVGVAAGPLDPGSGLTGTLHYNEYRLKLLEMLQDADRRPDNANKGENVIFVEAAQAIYDGLVHEVKEIIDGKRNGRSQ